MAANYRSVTTTVVESYSHAIPGVDLNAVQIGQGIGPNTVKTAVFDDATIGLAATGFPVRAHMTMSDDCVVVGRVSAAPPGTRWCGYDIEPGDTLLYAPGSEHTAVSPAGVGYTFAIVQRRRIEEAANELRIDVEIPQSGDVRVLAPAVNDRSISFILASIVLSPTDVANAEHPSAIVRDVTQSLVSELAGESGRRQLERSSVRESRRIVRSCLEFVLDSGGSLSTAELCGVAHVSERRLRNAFVDAFGVAPMKYFRDLRLNEARRQLLVANKRRTVMEISVGLGIENGGRFAQRYFNLFGELPSRTLLTSS